MATNPVVHWEIMGKDGAAVAAFYGKVFDWAPKASEGFEGYHLVDTEHGGVGGAVGQGNENWPTYVTIYVQVKSIDDHLKKIEAAGGKTVAARTVIPGVVTWATFRDPAGNVVGLVEEETPPAA